jgi:type II secretory pathway pseudopilin PulG
VVELMVVVGIIAVLVALLIPVVAGVRRRGYVADTQNWVRELSSAIERYHQDFRAYPGPIGNNQIWRAGQDASDFGGPGGSFVVQAPAGSGFDTTVGALYEQLTSSENLVLGLLGGLRATGTPGALALVYDPSIVGQGAQSLNPAQPKRHTAYIDPINLSWRTENGLKTGKYEDGAGAATDTLIPEFVDRYPGTEAMPIIYLRSKTGVQPVTGSPLPANNNAVVTNNTMNPSGVFRYGAYDISQLLPYTGTNPPIGEGKRIAAKEYVNSTTYPRHGLQTVRPDTSLNAQPPAGLNYAYPYDAFPYLENPGSKGVARQKDGYILISAGADRVYGTRDDIASFGSVTE